MGTAQTKETMMDSPNTNECRIEHLYSAAFAIARGERLLRIEGAPGTKRRFVFPGSAARNIAAYFEHGPVPGKKFMQMINELRTLARTAPDGFTPEPVSRPR
jgi:hypothetical protein